MTVSFNKYLSETSVNCGLTNQNNVQDIKNHKTTNQSPLFLALLAFSLEQKSSSLLFIVTIINQNYRKIIERDWLPPMGHTHYWTV